MMVSGGRGCQVMGVWWEGVSIDGCLVGGDDGYRIHCTCGIAIRFQCEHNSMVLWGYYVLLLTPLPTPSLCFCCLSLVVKTSC